MTEEEIGQYRYELDCIITNLLCYVEECKDKIDKIHWKYLKKE